MPHRCFIWNFCITCETVSQQFASTTTTRHVTSSSIRFNFSCKQGRISSSASKCSSVGQSHPNAETSTDSAHTMSKCTGILWPLRCQLAPHTTNGHWDISTLYHFTQMLGRTLHHTGISVKMLKVLYSYFICWDSLVREGPATWLLKWMPLGHLKHSHYNAQITHSLQRLITCSKFHKIVIIQEKYSCAFH